MTSTVPVSDPEILLAAAEKFGWSIYRGVHDGEDCWYVSVPAPDRPTEVHAPSLEWALSSALHAQSSQFKQNPASPVSPGPPTALEEVLDALEGVLQPNTDTNAPSSLAFLLGWVADRLVNVYHESPNVDFVLALRNRYVKASRALEVYLKYRELL